MREQEVQDNDGIIDAEGEELVRRHLASYPEATQRELQEKLLGERGVEVDANAFARWARKKGLTTAYNGLRAFTRAQVEQATSDTSSPLDKAERAYLAARKGIGGEPLDQKEAARKVGLPAHENARRFERIAIARLREYFANEAGPADRQPRPRRAKTPGEGAPLNVSSAEVAEAIARARAVGLSLTDRQERVVRGLWGVEGAAMLRPVDLARAMGVHRHTVRDIGLRALAALGRAGLLADPAAPRTERRAPTHAVAWSGLLEEDLAALVEAFMSEGGPWMDSDRSLPNAEILRLAYGLKNPADHPRPLLRDVALELEFTSGVRFKRAHAGAIEGLLRAAGLEGVGPEHVSSRLEEKAAEALRRARRGAGGSTPGAAELLSPGSGASFNPLGGLTRGAAEFALASPYGLLSRRERYVLGLRGGLLPPPAAPRSGAPVPTQGEVAELMGVYQKHLGQLERRAAEKLRRLVRAVPAGEGAA